MIQKILILIIGITLITGCTTLNLEKPIICPEGSAISSITQNNENQYTISCTEINNTNNETITPSQWKTNGNNIYYDTGNVIANNTLYANRVQINSDTLASLHIKNLNTGTSDINMGGVTLNSRGVGMIIEASGSKAGTNSIRPGIYMFNSRTDNSGLAFPLFRVYTGRNDAYSSSRGATFGAYASSGGNDFRYMYIGTNNRQSWNNHVLRVGEQGITINPPAWNSLAPSIPLTVHGETLIKGGNLIVEGNIQVSGCIIYNGGTLGVCN